MTCEWSIWGWAARALRPPDAAPRGTAIELVIDPPHLWDPLTLTGAVAWSRALADADGGGMMLGICFELATSASVRALTELLEAEAFS